MEGLKKFACEKIAFSIAKLNENIQTEFTAINLETYTKSILALADAFAIICNSGSEKGKVGIGND